jgi:hypothetical protein
MHTLKGLALGTISLCVLGLSTSVLAVDLDSVKKKTEAVKGHAENVKKEGGEVKQSVKDMTAQDAMKNTGEMKDEGKKLKDVVTGK